MRADEPRTELLSIVREIRYGIANHPTIEYPLEEGGRFHPDEVVIRQLHMNDNSWRTVSARTEGPIVRLDSSTGPVVSRHWMGRDLILFDEAPRFVRDCVDEARAL